MTFNLYTFGCSFTNYVWSTWADILGKYAVEYKNFGQPSAGNYFIFHQLINFITNRDFKDNDIIAICWSTHFREDRIIKKKWLHSGSLFSSNKRKEFSENYLEIFFDVDHYIERDRCFIIAAIEMLEAKNINYIMFSLDEIFLDSEKSKSFFETILIRIPKSFQPKSGNLYKENKYSRYKNKILTPVKKYLEKSPAKQEKRPVGSTRDRVTGEQFTYNDHHPTPLEHLDYVENILLSTTALGHIKISNDHRNQLFLENQDISTKINII